MALSRIDVHHHILPQGYVDAIGAARLGAQGSSGRLPDWGIDHALALMDEASIDAAITSISAPGTVLLPRAEAAQLARWCNDFAASMAVDHPSRFGFFATLPLPSIDDSLSETSFAIDRLKADGVCLLSNYDGRYLGDEFFWPLYEELNRRQAVIFMHPTSPTLRVDLPGLSPSMLEFPFDTTRTIASLIFAGIPKKFPAIRWIFSHAGGALPYLAGRFEFLCINSPNLGQHIAGGFKEAVRPFYFDTALSANAGHFASLRELVDDDRILFGSDYPFGPKGQMAMTTKGLRALDLPDAARVCIDSENAKALFPRLVAANDGSS